MLDEKKFLTDLQILRKDFSMIIPDDFIEYIKERKKFDFTGHLIYYNNNEAEFNNFLLFGTDDIQDNIVKWYVLENSGREEYLSFAFGGGNDEFAIKVLGGMTGGIYHIYHKTEEKLQINYMFINWKEFVNQLI